MSDKEKLNILEQLREVPDLSNRTNEVEIPQIGRLERPPVVGHDKGRDFPDTTSDTQASKRTGNLPDSTE